jgi:hypothetical protein
MFRAQYLYRLYELYCFTEIFISSLKTWLIVDFDKNTPDATSSSAAVRRDAPVLPPDLFRRFCFDHVAAFRGVCGSLALA